MNGDLTDEDKQLAGWYAEAHRQIHRRLPKHRGPLPEWAADVAQEAVLAAWAQAKAGADEIKITLTIARTVRREIDRELDHQERRNG